MTSVADAKPPPHQHDGAGDADVARRYQAVRRLSYQLAQPLSPEDTVAQSMPDASPIKWHLAHTTWFFEQFVLQPFAPRYRPFHRDFSFMFNSYYNAVGDRVARPMRGLMTRPSLEQVMQYRDHVDAAISQLLDDPAADHQSAQPIIETGLHHEQQHQELMLTDLKHLLSLNPLNPVYLEPPPSDPTPETAARPANAPAEPMSWRAFDEAVTSIGHAGPGFAFDNETPRHRTLIHAFELADRLVTNRQYLQFIEAGGYEQPLLWLDEGWARVQADGWRCPLYWRRREDQWHSFTLHGLGPLDLNEPVCHVSFYEADALARFAGARLATEAEWEAAAANLPVTGQCVEAGRYQPSAAIPAGQSRQPTIRDMYGKLWQWTASAYRPYPGFQPAAGALGEYNGKFMCSQFVLRGGSCCTSQTHIRPTYRNFFHPSARWQFTGIRLAKDA